jgi:hypothetical protein
LEFAVLEVPDGAGGAAGVKELDRRARLEHALGWSLAQHGQPSHVITASSLVEFEWRRTLQAAPREPPHERSRLMNTEAKMAAGAVALNVHFDPACQPAAFSGAS